jgi:TolB protein
MLRKIINKATIRLMGVSMLFGFVAILTFDLCFAAPRKIPTQPVESHLEVFDISSNQRQVVHTDSTRFEAPNWTRDGKQLIFNQRGLLYRLPANGGKPIQINTGIATSNNNDHGISADGKWLAISHHLGDRPTGENSTIFIVPIGGGEPRRVTANAPSYWHGWSPDGKTLAFVGSRNGEFDIYTIPVIGGEEKRLTTAKGLDDGPDYSPDGKHIYFNSVRTGKMQIWRMKNDGSDQIQLTDDQNNNWFPHPSPDGKWIVFLTYLDAVAPDSHPADKNVMLRLMGTSTRTVRELCRFIGGQGTINVPSWAPDSRRFAFVSYK